jgi:hypothetical protein
MFSSSILDTLIALIFIYFLLSTLVSCTIEYYAQKTKRRSVELKKSINKILNDSENLNFASLLYAHPMIKEFREKVNSLPSYVDSKTFSKVLIDLIQKQGSDKSKVGFESFINGINTLKNGDLKTTLQLFVNNSKEISELELQIQHWYESYMDRATGWYKKGMRQPLFLISAIYVVLFNVNFIDIAKHVYQNESIRSAIVVDANAAVQNQPKFTEADIQKLKSQLTKEYELPIGWGLNEQEKLGNGGLTNFFKKLAKVIYDKGIGHVFWGYLISAFIMSFGAPFWFDILKKVVNMRGGGLKTLIDPKPTK